MALAAEQHSAEDLNAFDALTMKDCGNVAKEYSIGKKNDSISPVQMDITCSTFHAPVQNARPTIALPSHGADANKFTSRSNELDKMKSILKETFGSKTEADIKALEHEVLHLKKENGRLAKLLKENELKLDSFANERMLWEQKKLSEMSTFNAFKEEETQRLKRERGRLEKQAKLLVQLPSKKERNEIEELRSKIASLSAEQARKDSAQNLTINRLRRTIADLTDQIYALQEEVKRYERFLHAELEANEDTCRKLGMPRVLVAEKPTSHTTDHGHDKQSNHVPKDMKFQAGNNLSRVPTTMHWTRA